MPPLLKEVLGLDIWPGNGLVSDKGLRTAANLAQLSNTFPLDKLANWSFVNKAALSLKTK
jgi:hypothetical protein